MATKYQRSGSDSWYLQWWDAAAGKQRKLSLGTITEQAAERARAIKDLELAAGVTLTQADAGRIPASILFDTFVDDHYAPWHRQQYPHSSAKLGSILAILAREFGKMPLANISTAVVEQWKVKRMRDTYSRGTGRTKVERRISPVTVKRDLAQLSAIFQRALRWNHIKEIPFSDIEPPPRGNDALPKAFTKDELHRIYETDPIRAHWWRFMVNTGLRRGEAMKARRADIRNMGDGSKAIIIESNAAKGERTKSGKLRIVPLNAGALAALELLGEDHLFPRVGRIMLTRHFGNAARAADVDGTLHGLRHTFCSHLADAGVSARVIQELAGHSSLEITMQYMHLAPGAKNAAVCRINL